MEENDKKILDKALEHDKLLNIEESKITNEIKKEIEKIKDDFEYIIGVLEELEEFNKKETKEPMLKEDEYRIFVKLIEKQSEAYNSLMKIIKLTLEYKMLLDREIF